MNVTTFLAMLARDAHVARRNSVQLAFQTLMQPMMFVFVFGRVMTTSGLMSAEYKGLLLPGIIALSMIMTGTWAVSFVQGGPVLPRAFTTQTPGPYTSRATMMPIGSREQPVTQSRSMRRMARRDMSCRWDALERAPA